MRVKSRPLFRMHVGMAVQDGNPLETGRAQSRPLCALSGASESSRCLLRCHEGEKKPMSCRFTDLYGSPSCRHHDSRASPPHGMLPLPTPHPFPAIPLHRSAPRAEPARLPPQPRPLTAPRRAWPPTGRDAADAPIGPGCPRGRISALSANRQR